MLRSLLVSWIILAGAFALTAWLINGMDVSGGVWGYLWVSLLFGIVNALIGTIVRFLTLPLIFLTLGLFAVLINAALLELTDWLSSNLTIDSFFWTAIWAAIVLSLVTILLDITVGKLLSPDKRSN